jgi:hypothetical protein
MPLRQLYEGIDNDPTRGLPSKGAMIGVAKLVKARPILGNLVDKVVRYPNETVEHKDIFPDISGKKDTGVEVGLASALERLVMDRVCHGHLLRCHENTNIIVGNTRSNFRNVTIILPLRDTTE